MQKILVIHSSKGKLEEIARGIVEGAANKGDHVDILSTKDIDRPVNFRPYDLILAGSPTLGLLKGKISEDLSKYLQRSKGTVWKRAIVFVTPALFGTGRALKRVMTELEKLGCVVIDFVDLKNYDQAFNFGKNL